MDDTIFLRKAYSVNPINDLPIRDAKTFQTVTVNAVTVFVCMCNLHMKREKPLGTMIPEACSLTD